MATAGCAGRWVPLALALLLAAVVALALIPQVALAASGGVMGGRSSSSSEPDDSSSSSKSYTFYDSSSHISIGAPSRRRAAKDDDDDGGSSEGVFRAVLVGLVSLVAAVWYYYERPSTTVVKLQVALLGWAKPFQKELNEIADRVQASNKRSYKFMLTETICSLSRHRDCCVFSSLSVNVKNGAETWEAHFDKLSIKERSKFDEETLYNLEGIKRTKEYSKKLDGSRNEYIVVTILVAAKGALKFPKITRPADLEAVVEKLNSIPAREIQGVHVLWTPQDENDVLSEEKLLADYPNLKPHNDY
ncbi:uncharacterized protein LOC123407095 isoform X1 [Hordeum vulgare subsp. vulgare]|uniref:Uncharacterized protein n=1 Tax=Hordeum vulgare subsp. vulgare TaxID=112509 RepID=A0A8I7BEN1_HORVV|nr:uncharacterized protein LOC123407095 isoform X1 [Hordeum vulgare subsp. vulgare]